MNRSGLIAGLALLLVAPAVAAPSSKAADDDTAGLEFFEAKVRPLLVNRCQSCHGGGKAKGGLRLDTRATALGGGDTGPALVPGKPDESLLVEAIRYGEALQMPPKSKLPAEEIAVLTRWVEQGAPWPVGRESAPPGTVKPFNLRERAGHWSLQPVQDPAPPEVKDQAWPLNPVDRFLLAKLEAKGLKPAAEAEKPTLIRRLTFDLIGLPPKPEEVEAFVADASPDAYETLVERLLASPHYGERWGRHWLDLVRFAETSGHEFDYDIPLAYRYRDYVIRAFNADLPYDQFVVEQLAGDLLPEPRRDPSTGTNESILGTGSYRFHEGVHSPVDLREDGAAKFDSQIDVLSKAFLGLTIACARCHDHKFDAITTRDYYALNGYARQLPACARLPRPARPGIRPQAGRAGGPPPPGRREARPAALHGSPRRGRRRGGLRDLRRSGLRRLVRLRRRLRQGPDGLRRVADSRRAGRAPAGRAWPTAGRSRIGSAACSGRRPSPSPSPTSIPWPRARGGGSTW